LLLTLAVQLCYNLQDMKKLKIICLALSFFALLFMVACQAPDNSITFAPVPPFSGSSFEYIEYSIQKTDLVVNKYGKEAEAIIAEGTLNFTLKFDGNSTNHLDMNFEITYNNLAPEIDRGKTDSIVASAEFSRISLSPLASYRKVTVAPRDDKEDLSYEIQADYNSKTATMTTHKDTPQQQVKQIKINSNDSTFDNEYLFYLIRSSNQLTLNGQSSFNLSVLYDSFSNGSFLAHPMVAVAAAQPTYVTVKDSVANDIQGITDEDGKNNINALQVNIGMGYNINNGPAIVTMYSTDNFFIDGQNNVYVSEDKQDPSHRVMSKVMLQMSTTEFENNVQKYITTYTMSRYVVDPNKV